ncbi:hypothetical protein ACFL6N_04255 [Thermodesulfobacteriota bacterium]
MMGKNVQLLMLLVMMSGLFGCATANMGLSEPAEPYLAPDNDKALVYFIRPVKLGFLIHAAVYDDEEFIGFVPYNQKLPYLADPGEHMFMVVSEAADFLKAELQAGKTYYIKVMPRMGAWRARFSLAPVTKADLETPRVQKWITDAQLIRNKDEAYEWAEKNKESVLKKKTSYLTKWETKPIDKQPTLLPEDCE